MPADDNLRGMFDQFGSPEPTDEQREAARRNLQASIRQEAATSSRWWRGASLRWSAATVVAAAVIAFVLFVTTVFSSSWHGEASSSFRSIGTASRP